MSKQFFLSLASLVLILFPTHAFADDWSNVRSTLITNRIMGLSSSTGHAFPWRLRVYWQPSKVSPVLLTASRIVLVDPNLEGQPLAKIATHLREEARLVRMNLRMDEITREERGQDCFLGCFKVSRDQNLFLDTETGRIALNNGTTAGRIANGSRPGDFDLRIDRATEIDLQTGLIRFLKEGAEHPWQTRDPDTFVRVVQPDQVVGTLSGDFSKSSKTRSVRLVFKLQEFGAPIYTFDHAEYSFFDDMGEALGRLARLSLRPPYVHVVDGQNLALNYDTGSVYFKTEGGPAPVAVWQDVRPLGAGEMGFHLLVPVQVDANTGSMQFHESEKTCEGALLVLRPNLNLVDLYRSGI